MFTLEPCDKGSRLSHQQQEPERDEEVNKKEPRLKEMVQQFTRPAPLPNLKRESAGDGWVPAQLLISRPTPQQLEIAKKSSRQESFVSRTTDTIILSSSPMKPSTTPSVDAHHSGLPPTPPTVTDSDGGDYASREESQGSTPQFADAVRNALRSEKSGVSTPAGRFLAPQTPGPSPPNRRKNTLDGYTPTSQLQPDLPHPPVVHDISSGGDSFHTAHDDADASDGIFSSKSAEALSLLLVGANSNIPHSIYHRQNQQCSTVFQPVDTNHLPLDSLIPTEQYAPQISAEDVNNLVYREIQTENAMRHTAVINGDAMAVGIIVPPAEKERTLKRTAKRHSLRRNIGDDIEQCNNTDTPRSRYNKQGRSLETGSISRSRPPVQSYHQSQPTDGSKIEFEKIRKTIDGSKTYARNLRTLRRSRAESQLRKLDSNDSMLCTYDEAPPSRSVSDSLPASNHTKRTLRRFSHGAKLENNHYVFRTSLEPPPRSPRRSFDLSQPTTTPMSSSQLSDRTQMEVCEARGVIFYPHNNKSLLVIDSGSRPTSKHRDSALSAGFIPRTVAPRDSAPYGTVHGLELRTPQPHGKSDCQTASPLVNPRAAPEPPAFRVIPPTPINELDLQHVSESPDNNGLTKIPGKPQRRQSLVQRARRYSESVVQPFFTRTGSFNGKPRRASVTADAGLSPMWKPRGFWEGLEYDDDYDEVDERAAHLSLSNTAETHFPTFPSSMSVRMPGFHGSGGFLLGNSLDLDRHGSNKRRHHVHRRTSDEALDQPTSRGRRLSLPFYGARTTYYSGLTGFRERVSDLRMRKEEKRREKRRDILRGQIHLQQHN